jgi:hypothetical protein
MEDLKEVDDEALVDVYAEIAPSLFSKEVSRIPVPDYAIICDVAVTVEKPKKKGGKPTLTIAKQQANKIKKLMESTSNLHIF